LAHFILATSATKSACHISNHISNHVSNHVHLEHDNEQQDLELEERAAVIASLEHQV
jgi:hypothetical protein